ncbi:ABC transporter permease [Natranaerobius thermophilus]|nr:ABC transporter permease [Natranaerobius thermophilus]
MFLNFFTDNPSSGQMAHIITGNMMFALVITGLNVVAQNISQQKHQGHFTFYASLPISKINFILANLARGAMTSLPSFCILFVIGRLVYDVDFYMTWALFPATFLIIMSVVGIGAYIGFWSPNQQLTSMLVQALMMLISFLTPVMVRIEDLPSLLQLISRLLPTTYAAETLRILLISGLTQEVLFNAAILLVFTCCFYILILNNLDWRIEE